MREKKVHKEEVPKKIQTPNIVVDLPITAVRKSFAIKEPLVKDLSDYAAFLSEHYGKAIDEDRVIEGLLNRIKGDKLFIKWKRELNNA